MRALVAAAALGLLATAAIAQSSYAERDAARLARILAGRTAGTSQICVPMGRGLNSTRFLDGSLIFMRANSAEGDRIVWRNQPANGGCAPGQREVTMVTQRGQNQACRGDIVFLYDQLSNIPQDQCVLGAFTPYTKPR